MLGGFGRNVLHMDSEKPDQGGKMLQRLRESKGLSQSELAKKSGVSIRTIQAYECGSRDIMKAQVQIVVKLADALGCDIREVIQGKA